MSKIVLLEFLAHFVIRNTEGDAVRQTFRINRRLIGAEVYVVFPCPRSGRVVCRKFCKKEAVIVSGWAC